MTNSKTLFKELVSQINTDIDRGEAEAMIYRLLDSRLNIGRRFIIMEREIEADAFMFAEAIARINQNEPIQYILNEENFNGHNFYVDPSVLIPRPETGLLVGYCQELLRYKKAVKVIDIGTGSGCISITLAIEDPTLKVFATDISEAALQVAQQNAKTLQANVSFLKHDILNEELPYNDFDLIVSNPPYISEKEKATMLPNVLVHEPHLALFAGDDDVLIFYKAIVKQAMNNLKSGGYVAVEINEHFGKETAALFSSDFFTDVKIIKDINSKDRIVIARKV